MSCDDCQKWRRVGHAPSQDRWSCRQNTDPRRNSCYVPQELSDAAIDAEIAQTARLVKQYKKDLASWNAAVVSQPKPQKQSSQVMPDWAALQQKSDAFFQKQGTSVAPAACVDLCSSDDDQAAPAVSSQPSQSVAFNSAPPQPTIVDPRDKLIHKRLEGMAAEDKEVLELHLSGMNRPEQVEYLNYLDLERAKEESKEAPLCLSLDGDNAELCETGSSPVAQNSTAFAQQTDTGNSAVHLVLEESSARSAPLKHSLELEGSSVEAKKQKVESSAPLLV